VTEFLQITRVLYSSNIGQPMRGIRKSLHHANQQGGLGIRLRSPLLPILEGPHVGPQILREERTRKVQVLSNSRKLASD
jgi:hypothetical protein